MTDWMPINMQRDHLNRATFFIKCNLPKNYLHRFIFRYNNEEVVDKSQPHSEDIHLRVTNTIFIGNEQNVDSEMSFKLQKLLSYKPKQMGQEMKELMEIKIFDNDHQLM